MWASVFLSLCTVVQMHVCRRLSCYFVCATQMSMLGPHGITNQKRLSRLRAVDDQINTVIVKKCFIAGDTNI